MYDGRRFNEPLYGFVIITWIICFLCIIRGVKSIQITNLILVPISFGALVALMCYYITLNDNNDGNGMGYYLGGLSLPNAYNESETSLNSLFIDAYN